MKDLLKMQIMDLKAGRRSDDEIASQLRTFYGFVATQRPTIRIQAPDSMETSEPSPDYVDLESEYELAARIHSLCVRNGFSNDEIRDRLSNFSAYLRKLDEENERMLLLARESATIPKAKQKRQKGKKLAPSQREATSGSMMSSSSTPALPPMQKKSLDLASILRRGSGDGFPYSPINAADEQRVKSPKRRASFGSLSFEVSASSSQDGADPIFSNYSPPKKLLSPIHGTDSGEGDGFYRTKRKAPLPWKQQAYQSNGDVPVSGVLSKDGSDIGSIDHNIVSDDNAGEDFPYVCYSHDQLTGNTSAIKSSFDSSMVVSHEIQQPLCRVCGMSFKTSGSLERHLNFSVCSLCVLRKIQL